MLRRPYQGAVESDRGNVNWQKGDLVQAEGPRGARGFEEVAVICFLNCAASGDANVWAQLAERENAVSQQLERGFDAADGVVDCRWTIERNDDVVEDGGDRFRMFFQQQTSAQESETDSLIAKDGADLRELWIHKRLAAGEHDPADAETANRFELRLQLPDPEDFVFAIFPDVAHDAAAVAGAVRVDDQDRKSSNDVSIVNGCGDENGIFSFNWQGAPVFHRDGCGRRDALVFQRKASRAGRESSGRCLR